MYDITRIHHMSSNSSLCITRILFMPHYRYQDACQHDLYLVMSIGITAYAQRSSSRLAHRGPTSD